MGVFSMSLLVLRNFTTDHFYNFALVFLYLCICISSYFFVCISDTSWSVVVVSGMSFVFAPLGDRPLCSRISANFAKKVKAKSSPKHVYDEKHGFDGAEM